MGKKIFISYKYSDGNVRPLNNNWFTTARDYVDVLQSKIDKSDHINKGEDDGEDMSSLADSTIASKLGDKIFDSSVTIVFISKGMKENKPDKDQWIPWELSYSLREQSRQGINSKTNAVLAVVLPDENGRYDYFITHNQCDANCSCRTLHTDTLFEILRQNMFNRNAKTRQGCSSGRAVYTGRPSYIHCVKWDDFIDNINDHIDSSLEIWRDRSNYSIQKSV